ncbi:CotO family spore coat protein [Neobacillus cucumis]|uniref:Spore coat protein CotO n=1 Tax=Neobacillus cucumis TaxID=1740721 RepID=A0A2N5HBN2_9BACI|nr:CotO family spore coat protein [Neobacillus cucumis]PLS02910.1 hypothetical protein CVD27_17150 [Neobacillus cucumis]
MSTKKSQGPLLYIHQAFNRAPSNNNMQEVYTSRRELEITEEEQPQLQPVEEESEKTISLDKKELILEEVVKPEPKEVIPTVKPKGNKRSSLKRVKPFKEMDLFERLDYLINFPKVLPPVPCVFYTTEGNIQGYLTEYTDKHVTVRFHDQTYNTIPLEQLTNVIMIGIKT